MLHDAVGFLSGGYGEGQKQQSISSQQVFHAFEAQIATVVNTSPESTISSRIDGIQHSAVITGVYPCIFLMHFVTFNTFRPPMAMQMAGRQVRQYIRKYQASPVNVGTRSQYEWAVAASSLFVFTSASLDQRKLCAPAVGKSLARRAPEELPAVDVVVDDTRSSLKVATKELEV